MATVFLTKAAVYHTSNQDEEGGGVLALRVQMNPLSEPSNLRMDLCQKQCRQTYGHADFKY